MKVNFIEILTNIKHVEFDSKIFIKISRNLKDFFARKLLNTFLTRTGKDEHGTLVFILVLVTYDIAET